MLASMAQGLTNAGIAKRLWLSERTVEAHIRRVLVKLGIAETEDHNRRVLAVLLHLGVPSATRPRRLAPVARSIDAVRGMRSGARQETTSR